MAAARRGTGKEFHEYKGAPAKLGVEILCQDPLVHATTGLGTVSVKITGERYLGAGPTSARVEVIDRDLETGELHPPVKVLAGGKGFATGRVTKDLRTNYLFHQVNVWAIVNRTLALLEEPSLLGRPVRWASGRGRLILMPHAGHGANAYYEPRAGALLFKYYGEADKRVFSCLSHDIITHELGHAVLDGLKPGYDEITSVESAGFHEYFGDALALISALTFREVLVRLVGKAPPVLDAKFLDTIGEELGNASSAGDTGYVRRLSDRRTVSDLVRKHNQSAHDYSQVLSGVLYEYLTFLYELKLEETRQRKDGALNGGVAVTALVLAAKQAARTMFCAVDYCPPVDVSFAQYAKAVLRADEVAFPDDARGFRAKLTALFQDRGVDPLATEVGSDVSRPASSLFHPYDVDSLSATSEDAYRFLDANRTVLRIPHAVNFEIVRRYRTRKTTPSGHFPPREVVLEFVWSEELTLANDRDRFGTLAGLRIPVPCGGTLVLDTNGNILHYVLNPGTEARRKRTSAYIEYLVNRGQIGLPGQELAPIVAFREDDNRVQLQRTPMLRHEERRTSTSDDGHR